LLPVPLLEPLPELLPVPPLEPLPEPLPELVLESLPELPPEPPSGPPSPPPLLGGLPQPEASRKAMVAVKETRARMTPSFRIPSSSLSEPPPKAAVSLRPSRGVTAWLA
jgi:periplasmic protein TonB